MLDTTLGYFLCCQSPTLFLAALLLLLCYFTRKKAHHARSVLDLILCILCAAGGVALYFLGMGKEYFSIRDFYVIRTPGWIGMLVVVAFAVWLVVRGFLALNRRRMAEKKANRAANAEAHQREEDAKAAAKQQAEQEKAAKAAAKQQAEQEKAANAAAVAHISEEVDSALTPSDTPDAAPAMPDPSEPISLTLDGSDQA